MMYAIEMWCSVMHLGQMEAQGNERKVVLLGRRGAAATGIQKLMQGMVMKEVYSCSNCRQMACKRICCDRCSELVMGLDLVSPRLPLPYEPTTCAPPSPPIGVEPKLG